MKTKATTKIPKTPIGTIEEELAACRKAFQENPEAKYAWCCHHSVLLEPLTEPYENRIKYILSYKEAEQQAIRFRNFRPVRIQLPEKVDKAVAELDKAVAELDKALAKYNEACAKLNEARAKWNEASAKYDEAEAKYNEARAKYDEAWAKLSEARAKYDEAVAELDKVYAEWDKNNVMLSSDWPDNTWNGQDIL